MTFVTRGNYLKVVCLCSQAVWATTPVLCMPHMPGLSTGWFADLCVSEGHKWRMKSTYASHLFYGS